MPEKPDESANTLPPGSRPKTQETTQRNCVRLLDRRPQGVASTIYADALLKRGAVVFDELRQGVRDIEHLADPSAGQVRIGCAESFMAGLLPAIIERLLRRCPKIVVHAGFAHFDAPVLGPRPLGYVVLTSESARLYV